MEVKGMKKCLYCGRKIKDESAAFCPKCGNTLLTALPSGNSQQEQVMRQNVGPLINIVPYEEKPKKKGAAASGTLLSLLALPAPLFIVYVIKELGAGSIVPGMYAMAFVPLCIALLGCVFSAIGIKNSRGGWRALAIVGFIIGLVVSLVYILFSVFCAKGAGAVADQMPGLVENMSELTNELNGMASDAHGGLSSCLGQLNG